MENDSDPRARIFESVCDHQRLDGIEFATHLVENSFCENFTQAFGVVYATPVHGLIITYSPEPKVWERAQ